MKTKMGEKLQILADKVPKDDPLFYIYQSLLKLEEFAQKDQANHYQAHKEDLAKFIESTFRQNTKVSLSMSMSDAEYEKISNTIRSKIEDAIKKIEARSTFSKKEVVGEKKANENEFIIRLPKDKIVIALGVSGLINILLFTVLAFGGF